MESQEKPTDPDGESPIATSEFFYYLLFQAARRRDVAFDVAMAPFDFTASRTRVLGIIRRADGCTMNELAKLSSVDRTTLTREVDHLVARGLVARTVPPTDRRRVNLSLTAEGEAFHRQHIGRLIKVSQDSLVGVDPQQLRQLARVLQTVIRNLTPDPDAAEDVINFARSDKLKPLV